MNFKNSSELITWLKNKGLFAKKSLSQNFLINFEVIKKIVEIARISEDDTILEIGPGPGTLTHDLLKSDAQIISVEKDKRFANELNISFSKFRNFQVIENDILKVMDQIFLSYKLIKVVANIPYNITTKILEKLCLYNSQLSLAILMVQKEFGERICAKKGKISGSISRFIQFHFDTEIALTVPNSDFYPPPKVDSCILVLRPKNSPKINKKDFFTLVQYSFHNRRKKLISALKKKYPIQKIENAFKSLKFSENTRAEELTLDDFLDLFKILSLSTTL